MRMLSGFIQILCALWWVHTAINGKPEDWLIATWTLAVIMALSGIATVARAYSEEL